MAGNNLEITTDGLKQNIKKCNGLTLMQICAELGISYKCYCSGRSEDKEKYNIIKGRLFYNLTKDLSPQDKKDVAKQVLAKLIVHEVVKEAEDLAKEEELAKNRESEIVFKG